MEGAEHKSLVRVALNIIINNLYISFLAEEVDCTGLLNSIDQGYDSHLLPKS
jgi:hypothetical protein